MPLNACVVEWASTDAMAPSLWVATRLEYVTRPSAIAMYARLLQDEDTAEVVGELGNPADMDEDGLHGWHVAVHAATTNPWATFYYVSVDGGEAVGASGWLTHHNREDQG